MGLFLVRVARGSRATVEQASVIRKSWLPRHVHAFASARLGLVKVLRIDQEVSYSKYRKFRGDSQVISLLKAQ